MPQYTVGMIIESMVCYTLCSGQVFLFSKRQLYSGDGEILVFIVGSDTLQYVCVDTLLHSEVKDGVSLSCSFTDQYTISYQTLPEVTCTVLPMLQLKIQMKAHQLLSDKICLSAHLSECIICNKSTEQP